MPTTRSPHDRWAARPPYWINSPTFSDLADRRSFVVVDGGASSFIFDPIRYAKQGVEIVAFDPDPEAVRPVTDLPIRFVPFGLWNARAVCRLHVPDNHAISSIYPPNEAFLQAFGREVWPRRRATNAVKIRTISIDEAVKEGLCPAPHFVKLDIHSAEFEALTGTRESLNTCVGALVETWHNDVHAGQHLHGELEALMASEGFQLFDTAQTARWRHVVDGKSFVVDRSMLIASESLFFRREIAADLTLFAIACADMFSYSAFAIQLARRAEHVGTLARDDRVRIEADLMSIVRQRLRVGRFRRFVGTKLKRWKKSRRT